MLKAFGVTISEVDEQTIKNMAMFLGMQVEIYDLKCYDPEINPEDIILLFGYNAEQVCGNFNCKYMAKFPDVSLLNPSLNNVEAREIAFNELKRLKIDIDNNRPNRTENRIITKKSITTIKREELPDLNMAEILKKFRETFDKRNNEAWICTTSEGKKIRITINPEESSADIDLTFIELYLLRAAIDALKVQELEIVHRNSS